jgi:hypothetical protein
MTSYQIHRYFEEKRLSFLRLISLFIAVLLLITIKAYVFFLLLPVWTVWFISSGSSIKFSSLRVIAVFLAWYAFLAWITPMATGVSLPQLLADKQTEFYSVAMSEGASSLVEIGRLDGTWLSLFKNAPSALFRSLFFPLPSQAGNMLMWFVVFENVLVVLFVLWMCIVALRRKVERPTPLLWSGLCFAIALFIFVGLVTPIIGALVRYKVPAIPFFLLFFCSIVPCTDHYFERMIRVKPVPDT